MVLSQVVGYAEEIIMCTGDWSALGNRIMTQINETWYYLKGREK